MNLKFEILNHYHLIRNRDLTTEARRLGGELREKEMDTMDAEVAELMNHIIPTPGKVFEWMVSMRIPLRVSVPQW